MMRIRIDRVPSPRLFKGIKNNLIRSFFRLFGKIIFTAIVYAPIASFFITLFFYVFIRLIGLEFVFWYNFRLVYLAFLSFEVGLMIIFFIVGMFVSYLLSCHWGVPINLVIGDMLDYKLADHSDLFEWDRDNYLHWRHRNEFINAMKKNFDSN